MGAIGKIEATPKVLSATTSYWVIKWPIRKVKIWAKLRQSCLTLNVGELPMWYCHSAAYIGCLTINCLPYPGRIYRYHFTIRSSSSMCLKKLLNLRRASIETNGRMWRTLAGWPGTSPFLWTWLYCETGTGKDELGEMAENYAYLKKPASWQ